MEAKESEQQKEKLTMGWERQKLLTEKLQGDVDKQQKEMEEKREVFRLNKEELDKLLWQHESRLRELAEVRTKANDDIRKIAMEMGEAQAEINVLILEAQKFESQLEFLASEREMILKAQLDAMDIDPLF